MATARWGGRNTNRRRWIQLAFLAVFVVLPLFDLFRFDFGTGRLHLFRHEVWLDEWVAVDPTFGQVPADAAHIRFVIGGLARQVEILRLIGRLEIEVL